MSFASQPGMGIGSATKPHALAIIVLIVLGFAGTLQDEFLIARGRESLRTWLTIAAGLLAIGLLSAIEYRRLKALRSARGVTAVQPRASWLALLQWLVVYSLLSYTVMQKLAPRVLHEVSQPRSKVLVRSVSVELSSGRGCRRIAYFGGPGSALDGRLCRLSEPEYLALRAGAPIELRGTASRFGFLVRGHRALPAAADASDGSP